MKKIVTLAAVAIATAFTALPAQAQPDVDPNAYVVFVPYDDLNLASAAGSRTLENRIKTVAHRICGVEKAPGLAETRSVQSCRDDVLGSARPQISQALASNGTGSVSLAGSR